LRREHQDGRLERVVREPQRNVQISVQRRAGRTPKRRRLAEVLAFLRQPIAVARLLDKLLMDQTKSRASHGRQRSGRAEERTHSARAHGLRTLRRSMPKPSIR
jgi:hypothetical protein